MKLLPVLIFMLLLSGCGTVGGAVQGLGDDLFRLIEFGADRVL